MRVKKLFIIPVFLLVIACDKIDTKRVLEEDAARDKRGGLAVMRQILLLSDIGRTIADTTLFPKPALFKRPMVNQDSFSLDTLTRTWFCAITDTFANQPLRIRFSLRFGPNANGYPVLPYGPFASTPTDTAYLSMRVRDSINEDITRIQINIDNTEMIYRGYKNWWRTDSTGVLNISGSYHSIFTYQIGKNTASLADDLDYINTYQLNFIQVRLIEGQTIPSAGVVAFNLEQNLVQEKDGVSGTVAGDYALTGQVVFSGGSVSMKIGEYTFRVVIGSNQSIWIGN